MSSLSSPAEFGFLISTFTLRANQKVVLSASQFRIRKKRWTAALLGFGVAWEASQAACSIISGKCFQP